MRRRWMYHATSNKAYNLQPVLTTRYSLQPTKDIKKVANLLNRMLKSENVITQGKLIPFWNSNCNRDKKSKNEKRNP